jgi:hypothetical protein
MLNLSVIGTAQGQQLNASFTQGDVVPMALMIDINGVPLDLTNAVIKMTIGFPSPVVLSTTNGAIIVANPTSGQFTVNISSTDTASYIPGSYLYDLWIEPQTSPPVETQYITGTVSVMASITAVP